MACQKCPEKSVIALQHGQLCKNHFLSHFEERVFKTIKKYNLIDRNDVICVAVSGGKDSLAVLHLTRKYLQEHNLNNKLFALAIDEGIHEYRATTLHDLGEFCKQWKIPVTVVRSKEVFGHTLDEAYPVVNKDTKKKPCNVCGVWRRYLINKCAREAGATKVITGHNLDDEAQAIVMNWFKANTSLAAHLGPISGVEEHELFVPRVKPLYFCPEKEVRLYAFLKGFQIQFVECPYARDGYRAQIQDLLNDFEAKYKGTKQGIINSFLDLLPLLKERQRQMEKDPIQECQECGEPAHGTICNACKIKGVLMVER